MKTAKTINIELSPSVIFIGIVLGVLLTAANVYLGLYAGMTVAASVPAAVISMAIFKGLLRRKDSVLQSNIVQTMASAGESLAAGIIFTVPALVIVGAWNDFKFWPTTLIAIAGGLLGILFMIPLRRALITENTELQYPEGVACAAVLKAGEGASKTSLSQIVSGFTVGVVFKLLVSAVGLFKGTLEFAHRIGNRNFYFGTDVSPALVAVGYIVNWQIGTLMFLGGAVAWCVGIPLLGSPGDLMNESAMDAAWALWSTKIRYLGVGAMIIAGVQSIFQVRRGIVDGVGSMLSEYKNPNKKDDSRNISLMSIGVLFAVSFAIILGVYQYLIGHWGMTILTTVIMIVMSFFMVAVASYVVGLVGSSNSPVSGMTISALLVTGALLLAFGYEGQSAVLATLGVAAVVCCATSTAGDVCQDLKTGSLVGATPRYQQIAEVIGVVIPAFVIAPVLTLLHKAYVIGEGLKAPQAVLFANLTQGMFGQGELPKELIGYGMLLGLGVILFDELVLKARKSSFRLNLMAAAVGIYLPLSLSVPIFVGGLLRYFVERKQKKKNLTENDGGVLFSSGLIAGESITGVLIAILIVSNIDLKMTSLSSGLMDLLSFAALAAVVAYLYKRASMKA